MGQKLTDDDIDAVFWRESMRPIADEESETTGPCLASDGRGFVFAARVHGMWAKLDPGDSEGEPGEPLDPRYRYYRRLADFAPFLAALLGAGCAVLDAIGLCPIHSWLS